MAEGWIKLYRNIQEHWIWQDPQKLKWWLDILLLANHKDNKFLLGNELMQLERGEHHTSELKLAERWGVSKTTVRRFLNLLQSDEMIELKKSKKGTTLKVSNYNAFQDFSEDEKTIKEPQKNHKKTIKEPYENHTVYTNNNEKNEKNEKNDNNYINNNKEDELNPLKEYQNNIFPTPGMIEIQSIQKWSSNLGNELVVHAIGIAAENNVRNYKYIERILMDWNNNDIKTLDQAKAYSANRKKGGQKQHDRSRENSKQDKVEYDFNRPYTGPSYSDGEIDF
ncbi:DnaD domain protein [Clostridium brassicae]|uniref:DnaD domain protein n=1 Tax=Clostridium brassicae TaxID=2999072 RepID=A0ABT4D6L5_9CLOT|nr:DnaD domain protein [Clostridium brassicae]MCY6957928.1 DnaD domain protein [Clostridium brassicae]